MYIFSKISLSSLNDFEVVKIGLRYLSENFSFSPCHSRARNSRISKPYRMNENLAGSAEKPTHTTTRQGRTCRIDILAPFCRSKLDFKGKKILRRKYSVAYVHHKNCRIL